MLNHLTQQLEALASGPQLTDLASLVRIRHVDKIVEAFEACVRHEEFALLSHTSLTANGHEEKLVEAYKLLSQINAQLEDARVQLHPELSVVVLDADFGLTEDVCFFLAWCLGSCIRLVLAKCLNCDLLDVQSEALWERGCLSDDTHCSMYLWQGQPIKRLTPQQVEVAMSVIFQHTREFAWDDPTLAKLTIALQLRMAQLLVAQCYPDEFHSDLPHFDNLECEVELDRLAWCELRVLWACGTARLKLGQLQTLTWKMHAQSDHFKLPVQTNQGREVSPEEFRTYLRLTTKNWIGPRMRESLSKANNRRLLRPDEVGRNAAFEGNNRFCRARGSMDAMENAMHSLDVVQLMTCPEEDLLLAGKAIKELLVLRIMHNVLESATSCDLMGRHVVLHSLRTALQTKGGTDVNLYVHKVLELPGGFVVTPHQAHYPLEPVTVEEALRLWYNTHFQGNDPLGIAESVLLEDS